MIYGFIFHEIFVYELIVTVCESWTYTKQKNREFPVFLMLF